MSSLRSLQSTVLNGTGTAKWTADVSVLTNTLFLVLEVPVSTGDTTSVIIGCLFQARNIKKLTPFVII